jgi:TatD DNase family protein
MLVDSHCHLNRIDLSLFDNNLDHVIEAAKEQGVEHLLSVCVDLDDFPTLCEIAQRYQHVSISVGVHPANEDAPESEPTVALLTDLAKHPRCVAIGETGLDYYHITTEEAQKNQRTRFATHIQAAIDVNKPLIIHTRGAAQDTLGMMRSEKASTVGGVMHCFSENWDIAKQALDLNFYISISGIVTFKNAETIREVAKQVPLERLLIETDSPYLAPVPYRGKPNHPALVRYVAITLSELHQISLEELAQHTSNNFYRCFKIDSSSFNRVERS